MLMIHRIVLCEAPKAAARSSWATLSPDTEAMTAINAIQTATRIVRRWRAAGTPSLVAPLGAAALTCGSWFVLIDSFQKDMRGSAPEQGLGAKVVDLEPGPRGSGAR